MLGTRGVVVAMACVTQVYIINAFTNIEHKKLELHGKQLIFSGESLKDGILTYATCTKNTETKERQCQAVREMFPYSNGSNTCDLKIKLKRRNEEINMDIDMMSIFPLAQNKAVLYVIDRTRDGFVQFNTINFDDCKVATYEFSVVDLDNGADSMEIVKYYNDGFDVYAYSHLGSDMHYVIKFGPDGVREDRPLGASKAETFPKVRRISSISASRDKGMFFIHHINGSDNENEYEFVLRKPDGSDIGLDKHEVYEPIIYSINNDLIGVCFKKYASEPKFNCTQYNVNGERKFNINPMRDDKNTFALGIHNLPEGGILIFLGSCEPTACTFYDLNFSVIKVDATGATVGTTKIGKVKGAFEGKHVQIGLSFRKNKDNHDCVSIADYESTISGRVGPGLLGVTDYCFTDDDFTK